MNLKTYKLTACLCIGLFSLFCSMGCSETLPSEKDNEETTSGTDDNHPDTPDYAPTTGVLLLGKNTRNPEQGALAYINSEGHIEADVWQKANGSTLVGTPRDLYIYKDKLYILCGTDGDGANTDGGLIVADTATFKKEKTFALSTLTFKKPEGTGANYQPYLKTPGSLVVLDERNVFIKDAQGLFRFDTTTGILTAIEGTYHIANTAGGGGNLESKVSSKGLVVANGKLYIGSAGFWSEHTGVMEIIPNQDKVNRVLEMPVDLISGLVAGKENQLLLAHYVRPMQGSTKRSNKISQIDLATFQTAETIAKPTKISLVPGFFDKSGVTYDGDNYLYLSEIEETETKVNYKMTLNRISLSDGNSETLADFTKEVPDAQYLTTNPVMDKHSQYIYVSVADEMKEGKPSTSHLLIYDCSGNQPVLVQKISGQTSKTVCIYFK